MAGNSQKRLMTTSDVQSGKGSDSKLRAGKAGKQASIKKMSPDEGSASETKPKTPSNGAPLQSSSTKKPKSSGTVSQCRSTTMESWLNSSGSAWLVASK